MRKKSLVLSCLAVVTLLAPAAPAVAAPRAPLVCFLDSCDIITVYYSDASYTTVVGMHEDGVCGQNIWGEQTQYYTTSQDHC